MSGRSKANGVLVVLSGIMWFGFIYPDMLRLQEGILKGNGYGYYGANSALLDLAGALGSVILALVAASAARRGGGGERGRAVTAGVLGVLVVQVIIATMIPAGFFLGVHFK